MDKKGVYEKEIPFEIDYFDEIQAVRAGDRYEIKIFKDPEIRNRPKSFRRIERSLKVKSEEEKELYFRQSLYRTRREVELLIRANLNEWSEPNNGKILPPTFLTLTFEDHITDLKEANEYYGIFRSKLNYVASMGKKSAFLKYVLIPELTKKKRVHYHIFFFNLRYIKKEEIKSVWGKGFIEVKKAKDVDHAVEYLLKYVTKEKGRIWPKGYNRYSASTGLKRSIKIRDDSRLNIFLKIYRDDLKQTIIKNGVYDNKYCGRVQYFVCDLKKYPRLKSYLLAHEAEMVVK